MHNPTTTPNTPHAGLEQAGARWRRSKRSRSERGPDSSPRGRSRPKAAALAAAALAVVAVAALAAPATAAAQTGTLPEKPPIPAELADQDQISLVEHAAYSILVTGYCLWPPHWFDCTVAISFAKPAVSKADRYFPKYTQVGGTGDAFRHCLWASWLVIALRDVDDARDVTDLHEFNSPSADQMLMDLANNKIGLKVGQAQLDLLSKQNSGAKRHNAYYNAELECESRVRSGEAHTLPWADEYARKMDDYYNKLDEATGVCNVR